MHLEFTGGGGGKHADSVQHLPHVDAAGAGEVCRIRACALHYCTHHKLGRDDKREFQGEQGVEGSGPAAALHPEGGDALQVGCGGVGIGVFHVGECEQIGQLEHARDVGESAEYAAAAAAESESGVHGEGVSRQIAVTRGRGRGRGMRVQAGQVTRLTSAIRYAWFLPTPAAPC